MFTLHSVAASATVQLNITLDTLAEKQSSKSALLPGEFNDCTMTNIFALPANLVTSSLHKFVDAYEWPILAVIVAIAIGGGILGKRKNEWWARGMWALALILFAGFLFGLGEPKKCVVEYKLN